MRFKRFLTLLTLLFVSVGAFSQNMPPEWQKFTREGYYFSVRQETNKKKVKENEFLDYLLGMVRADLAKQIKITVRDEASLEKKSEDGHTSIAYSASSNFSTDVTLRFVETRTYYDKKKKEGYAIAWLSKAELQRIYNERSARIVSMLDASARAEQEGKLDVALKYAYWALVLNATLPETMTTVWPKATADESQPESEPVSLCARERIENILSGLQFLYLGPSEENPLLGRFQVTCYGKPVTSLDYTYNDGIGLSGDMQVRNGTGLVEFRSGMDVRQVDINVKLAYAGDAEMKLAMAEVAAVNFAKACIAGVALIPGVITPIITSIANLIKSSKNHPDTEGEAEGEGVVDDPEAEAAAEIDQATDQATYQANANLYPYDEDTGPNQIELLSQTVHEGFENLDDEPGSVDGDAKLLENVGLVLDAIGTKKYSSVRKYFTANGYSVFTKLIRYGNARVVDRSGLQLVTEGDIRTCRSVPMVFSFKTNDHHILEHVAFWFDAKGKIDNLTFALESDTISGILSKSQWSDGAKMALISFLENYRTAFALTRLDYISSIFSDDALIIVGRVVKKTRMEGDIRLDQEDIEYNKLTKESYLKRLKSSFASKEYINLQFANAEIYRLTRGARENLYGIQLKQDYFSSNYNDSGYLYLLVDMEDSTRPLIYIRTWQPEPDPEFGLYGPGNI
ncbi:MAG: hypothetical protein J6Y32_07975 [Bacteroidales bacterium]|nr:hypothetical protein [Bacteroidales bacterium]